MLWRAHLGFSFNDEPFIASLAQRLLQGDKLIVDEWHGAQLFGIVLAPFVKIFLTFNGSTEGLLLFLRYCFCFLWFLTSFCVYCSLRKYTNYAIFAYLYIILFAPLDYMTCSYTSFGIMSILLMGCLLLKAKDSPESVKKSILVGILSSLIICVSVLCSPVFALAYLMVVIAVASYILKRHFEGKNYYLISLFSNIFMTLLIGIACFYFLCLKGHNFLDLLNGLKQILLDPEHQTPLLSKIFSTIFSICKPMLVFYLVSLVLSLLYCFNKKVKRYRKLIFYFFAIGFIFSRILIAKTVVLNYAFNYEMLDLAIFGIEAFILLDKKPWKLFVCFGCVDIIYAFCTFIVSNTGLLSVSAALVPCGAIGIVFITLLTKEILNEKEIKHKQIIVALLVTVLLSQIMLQFYVRLNRQYWDSSVQNLTQEIKCGAAKGLVTTPETANKYEEEYKALKTLLNMIEGAQEKRFANFTDNPIIYVDAEKKFGTFSAWSFGYGDNLAERFELYYKVNPSKMAQMFFYDDDSSSLIDILDLTRYERYDYEGYHLLVEK